MIRGRLGQLHLLDNAAGRLFVLHGANYICFLKSTQLSPGRTRSMPSARQPRTLHRGYKSDCSLELMTLRPEGSPRRRSNWGMPLNAYPSQRAGAVFYNSPPTPCEACTK